MSWADLRLALTLCTRELRGGVRGFGVFLGCLFLGVLAISSVGSLGQALDQGLTGDAKAILGGDVSVSLTAREADEVELSFLQAQGVLTQTLSTRTMAHTKDNGAKSRSVLIELKGVDQAYPLYGQVDIAGDQTLAALLAEEQGLAGAVVDADLLTRLDLKLGDEIRVGEATFVLRGVITREPDRMVEFFNLGSRVLVSAASFRDTGLVRTGSFFRIDYLLRLSADKAELVAEDIRAAFPEAGWRVRTYTQAAPRVRDMLERLRVDLALVGLGALLVGGLGVAGGVRGYLHGRLAHIAAMKCMGGSTQVLFMAYLAQVLVLGFLGASAGMAVGATVPWIGKYFWADILPLPAQVGIYPLPLLQAALFGLLTILAFSLPSLLRALMVRPSIIFRGYIGWSEESLPIKTYVPSIIIFILWVGLVFWFADNPRLSTWFVSGILVAAGLFIGLAKSIHWLAGKIPPLPWASLRLGLANIHRPGSPGVAMVLALGFGLTALVAVALVNAALNRSLREDLAQEAPAYFFMDIRPDQVEPLGELLSTTAGVTRMDLRPMVRGRIVAIAGTPVEQAAVKEDVAWAVRGDRGFSYSTTLPPGSTLVRGQWWDKEYDGPPLISLTADLAAGFGVDLGDTLSVNILGRTLTGTIASIRAVTWTSLNMQFAILFSPGVLEDAPQTWLGTVYGQNLEGNFFRQITDTFPDMAVITVREVLDSAVHLMARMSAVFQVMAGLALVVGFLVLAGAFAADQHRRIIDGVIYKICGATRRDIMTILAAEFSLAGLLTGMASFTLGLLVAWAVVHGLMRLAFVPDVTVGVLTVLGGVAVSILVGLLGTWRALGRSAAPYLRNE